MKIVGAHEAQVHFSELVAEAERGDAVTITRRGKPIAQLVAIEDAAADETARGPWRHP